MSVRLNNDKMKIFISAKQVPRTDDVIVSNVSILDRSYQRPENKENVNDTDNQNKNI